MGVWSYLYTYLQSNLLEVLVFVVFYGRGRRLDGALVTTFSNAITHPVVFFGFMGSGWSYLAAIAWAEAFAIVSETLLHRRFGRLTWPRAFLASALANLVSWQIAPMLTYFLLM